MKPMTAYGVVHYLLRKAQGPAKERVCVSCETQAAHWAYDHLDIFERVDMETNKVYSLNFEHYQPMCGSCHQNLDRANDLRVQDLLNSQRDVRAA